MKHISFLASLPLLAGCLAAIVPVSSLRAESTRFPSHFDPTPVREEFRNAFFEAFTQNKALRVQPPVDDDTGTDAVLKQVWVGNDPDFMASLDRIQVSFEGSAGSVPNQDSFMVEVVFRDEGFNKVVVIRTSRPAVAGTEGGVMMFLAGDKARRTLIHGPRKTSIVAALPETLANGVRGVLLCPFDTSTKLAEREEPAAASKAKSARVEVKAFVKGKLLSGLRPGMARANISTSNGIPNDTLHFDETFSKDPHVDVIYQGTPLTEPIPFGEDGKLLQGVSLELELQNSAGYTRSSTLVETLEIAPVDRDFEFSVNALRKEFKVNSRSCFSILRTSEMKQKYFKVDVKAP